MHHARLTGLDEGKRTQANRGKPGAEKKLRLQFHNDPCNNKRRHA